MVIKFVLDLMAWDPPIDGKIIKLQSCSKTTFLSPRVIEIGYPNLTPFLQTE